jgi:hypothetical protein
VSWISRSRALRRRAPRRPAQDRWLNVATSAPNRVTCDVAKTLIVGQLSPEEMEIAPISSLELPKAPHAQGRLPFELIFAMGNLPASETKQSRYLRPKV